MCCSGSFITFGGPCMACSDPSDPKVPTLGEPSQRLPQRSINDCSSLWLASLLGLWLTLDASANVLCRANQANGRDLVQ